MEKLENNLTRLSTSSPGNLTPGPGFFVCFLPVSTPELS